ncbi:MAG TPA: HEAT repeat domain-containing protein [Steroidobacteraceae bacterium]|nr:HEAT repeat domain-containing protein [Steroidobacteraceae bacterium]
MRTAICLVLLALASPALAAELTLPRDGWSSWEVAAVDGAPAWCCWNGNGDERKGSWSSCKLDGNSGGFGNRDEETTDTVKIYARTTGGKVDRLRTLSASCPVQAATGIRDLGTVATDDSARWLIDLAKRQDADSAKRHRIGEDILAALAVHRGNLARDALAGMARNDPRKETRKEAVFWLAQVRGNEGAEITSSIMFNDKDPDVREHAAFALGQSNSPRVASDLIKLGNTDKSGDVRAQAWFWLAQSGAPEAENAIIAALKKDSDDDVREQAVFALSQLPDDRSAKALIAMAEDRSLPHEQRKRAVFWLGQSESDAAQAYLERVLTAEH